MLRDKAGKFPRRLRVRSYDEAFLVPLDVNDILSECFHGEELASSWWTLRLVRLAIV